MRRMSVFVTMGRVGGDKSNVLLQSFQAADDLHCSKGRALASIELQLPQPGKVTQEAGPPRVGIDTDVLISSYQLDRRQRPWQLLCL
jgi:hypothetical protein